MKTTLTLILAGLLGACGSPTDSPPTLPPPPPVDVRNTDYKSSPEISQLDSILFPLSGSDPSFSAAELEPLSFLGAATVVGLGEATHGTKEFFQFKHRIIKYLVQNHGFKMVAIEADVAESVFIDRWITGSPGDIDSIMTRKMLFDTWYTPEVRELIRSLRDYNSLAADMDKVHYVGIDCQYMYFQPNMIKEYFSRSLPGLLERVSPPLNFILNYRKSYSNTTAMYQQMDLGSQTAIRDSITVVKAALQNNKPSLVAGSTLYEFETMLRVVESMSQVNEVVYAMTHGLRDQGIRDETMAANVIAYSLLLSPGTKVAVWAHNLHVFLDVFEYSYNAFHPDNMGSVLKQTLGSQYKVLAFTFSKGSFSAHTNSNSGNSPFMETQVATKSPLGGSTNEIFYNAREDNFILRMSDITGGSPLDSWFRDNRTFLTEIGWAIYMPLFDNAYAGMPVMNACDVIVNFDISTAAKQLKARTIAAEIDTQW